MIKIDKLALGRNTLSRCMKYLTSGAYFLQLHPSPHLDTWAITDRGVLMYNPEYIESLNKEQIASMYAKAISHTIRKHATRGKMFTRSEAKLRRWARSASLTVNNDLAHAEMQLPDEAPLPERFGLPSDLPAEEYYRMLEDEESNQSQAQAGAGAEDEGDENGQQAQPKQNGWDDSGGSGNGNPVEGEPEDGKGPPGRDAMEMSAFSRRIAQDIADYASKNPGSVPGGLALWADALTAPPKVSWRDMLRNVVQNAAEQYVAGHIDFRYTGVSKKQAGVGYGIGCPIMPVLRAPVLRVDVVADTSGSMWNDLHHVIIETQGIIDALGASVRFWAADCEVYEGGKVFSADQIKKHLRGGGGTSFCPAFKRIQETGSMPNLVIYITDGYGAAPTEAPTEFETVWVIVPSGTSPCTWGTHIKIESTADDGEAVVGFAS